MVARILIGGVVILIFEEENTDGRSPRAVSQPAGKTSDRGMWYQSYSNQLPPTQYLLGDNGTFSVDGWKASFTSFVTISITR